MVLLPTHSSRTGFCATLKMALAATSGSKTGGTGRIAQANLFLAHSNCGVLSPGICTIES